MPQIWMTYEELARLLDCDETDVQMIAVQRRLDRKKSRDGFTRIKLDQSCTTKFYATIRGDDTVLDRAIFDLKAIHVEMTRTDEPTAAPEWPAKTA